MQYNTVLVWRLRPHIALSSLEYLHIYTLIFDWETGGDDLTTGLMASLGFLPQMSFHPSLVADNIFMFFQGLGWQRFSPK